jgi:hypothetical protein
MTAFLIVDTKRARVASAFPRAALRLVRGPSLQCPLPRAVPTARWQIEPDGRLTCLWQTDA